MKNRSINKRVSGRYYWWAHTAPVEVLHRRIRNEPPQINDTFHMLRNSTTCLFLSELIKNKYDFGGILHNIPTDIFFPEKRKSDLVFSSLPKLLNNDLRYSEKNKSTKIISNYPVYILNNRVWKI